MSAAMILEMTVVHDSRRNSRHDSSQPAMTVAIQAVLPAAMTVGMTAGQFSLSHVIGHCHLRYKRRHFA